MYFFSRLFGLNRFQSSSLMTANAAIITNRREKETALKCHDYRQAAYKNKEHKKRQQKLAYENLCPKLKNIPKNHKNQGKLKII